MRGRELLEAIEYIDDELVEEAADFVFKPKTKKIITIKWQNWCGAAACMVVLGAVSILAYQQHQKSGAVMEIAMDAEATFGAPETAIEITTDTTEADSAVVTEETSPAAEIESCIENATIIEAFPPKQMEQGNAVQIGGCYASPSKGDILIFHSLQQALEYYGAMDGVYMYRIIIDVFGERPDDNGDGTYHYAELRSSEAGHEMLTAEYERLLDLGYEVDLSGEYSLTACLTAEQIKNFDIFSGYGYAFRFASE